MKQAVLITAYKNIAHLNLIVDFFSKSNVDCFIHIDKKSSIADFEIENIRKKKNVKLLSQKYKVNWGGANHLKAILLLLNKAFNYSDYKYFHLITGHDFPIKSVKDISEFLENHNGKEFIEYNKFPYNNWENGGMDRLLYYNLYDWVDGRAGWGEFLTKKILKIQKKIGFKRSFSKDFPVSLYGGSTYWTLSRTYVDYIFEYLQMHSAFLKRFKYTFCSEEIFFQTILMNSPFKENAINNSLRFIVWEKRNGNYPANLDISDYASIKESDAFFARKFEFPVSESLLKQIQKDLTID